MMHRPAVEPDTAIWLFVVSAVVLTLWTTHFVLSTRAWLRERSARSFQVWYIALMVLAGMVSITLSRAARTWPEALWIVDVAVWVAPVLTWMLLSGGVVALWTWSRPDRRW